MGKTINIVGAGLAGSVMAYRYKKAGYEPVVYERDRVMGACWECDDYQLHPHFFHTDYDDVMRFVLEHTTIRPYRHLGLIYTKGEYKVFPPVDIGEREYDTMIANYNLKMWHTAPKEGVVSRIKPSNGCFHPDKYQGILDMRTLFDSLLEGVEIKKRDIRVGDLDGRIVFTGALDEYYNYDWGELPYRGMNVVHLKTEIGLPAATVNFPEADVPFLRMIDYRKFGYGDYIGIEAPGNDYKHYPVRTESSINLYEKYRERAIEDDLLPIGRLGTYRYLDTDDVIKDCLEAEL